MACPPCESIDTSRMLMTHSPLSSREHAHHAPVLLAAENKGLLQTLSEAVATETRRARQDPIVLWPPNGPSVRQRRAEFQWARERDTRSATQSPPRLSY